MYSWLRHAVLQMASARGSLAPLGGSSFTFNNPLGDTEMADAAHMTPNFHDNRWDLYALHYMHGSNRQVSCGPRNLATRTVSVPHALMQPR